MPCTLFPLSPRLASPRASCPASARPGSGRSSPAPTAPRTPRRTSPLHTRARAQPRAARPVPATAALVPQTLQPGCCTPVAHRQLLPPPLGPLKLRGSFLLYLVLFASLEEETGFSGKVDGFPPLPSPILRPSPWTAQHGICTARAFAARFLFMLCGWEFEEPAAEQAGEGEAFCAILGAPRASGVGWAKGR